MSGGGTGWAVVNGRMAPLAEAALAITDDGAVRGDGAFEAVGVWGGRCSDWPTTSPDSGRR